MENMILRDEEDLHSFYGSIGPLTRAAGLGLWKWNLNTGQVTYSRQLERMLGYEEGAIARHSDTRFNLIYEKDIPRREVCIQKLISGEIKNFVAEVRAARKDGTLLWTQEQTAITQYNPDGRAAEIASIVNDISELKNAQEQQKEEVRHWENLAHLAGVASWIWDIEGDYINFNEEYEVLLGYSLGEINGSSLSPLSSLYPIAVERREELEKSLAEFIRTGGNGTFSVEIPVRHKEGHDIWVHLTANVVKRDSNETPLVIRGGMINIDQRVKAEQKLREALEEKERFNTRLQEEVDTALADLEGNRRTTLAMFETNPHMNMIFDDSHNLIDCNPAVAAFFGFKDKEGFLVNAARALHENMQDEPSWGDSILMIKKLISDADFEEDTVSEFGIKLRGKFLNLHVVSRRIPYNGGSAVVLYITDMTELMSAGRELEENSRLLACINDAASRLMATGTENFDKTLCECMGNIGRLVDADRMYIWEIYEDAGNTYGRQVHEWSGGAAPQQGNDETAFIDFRKLPLWLEKMQQGESVNASVADRPEYEQAYFNSQQIKSLLVIPLILQDRLWGFVGLDDCRKVRKFSDKEESILRSGANILVSGMLRNDATLNLFEAKEEALASVKAKAEFLSRMSHEIRTPMNAIIGMTNVAQKAHDMDKTRYCLEKIESSSHQLLSIINDILDISKIDANKFEISSDEFDFEKMMENIFNIVQVKMEEKQQEFYFSFDEPVVNKIVSDELRLSQVLVNLLSNAVKFTPDCGVITLSARMQRIDKNKVRLRMCVKDNGIGIPEDRVETLFNSFEQADGSITRQYGGTGLGLSICKKIVTLMNGEIWAENNSGGPGASFIFEVDIALGSPLHTGSIGKTLRDDLKIMVVDDMPDVLEYFQNILGSFGLRCSTCSDGYDSIEKAIRAMGENNPYDLIFLDWKMPGINGAQTAQKIREITNNQVMVVMISSADWVDIEKEAVELELRHFLPKPILPSALYNKLLEVTDESQPEATIFEAEAVYDWGGKRILLVEDIEINREIISSLLDSSNIEIDYAKDGVEGVEAYRSNPERYDLILMDVQMPRMDGLAATRWIRSLEVAGARTIPIIAMTANAFNEDVKNCIEAGMNSHLAKPLNIDELFRQLGRYLK